MTSAATPNAQNKSAAAAAIASNTTSSPAGAVPAQPPVRSYASAATTTKTATPTPPAPAGASSQNAVKPTASPVNGGIAQGGPQVPQSGNSNPGGTPGMANGSEHGRKPSVVISASGASGYMPNGGPVSAGGNRPPINFGSMDTGDSPVPQPGQSAQSQPSGLQQPPQNPRVTSPAHSPSPIPQPTASGGKPPSGLQNQPNGAAPNFGSFGGEQASQGPLSAGMPEHVRRSSSQSMQSDVSNRGSFTPRNNPPRPFNPQGYGAMPTPPQNHARPSFPPGPGSRGGAAGMAPSFSPAQQQYYRNGRNSPAIPPAQPHMAQGQVPYGYGPHLGPQANMYMQPQGGFDPTQGGFYNPYYYGYPGQAPPQSPRPHFPTPYPAPQPGMQPPFHPTSMSRSASQVSERPASSMGNQTPSMQASQPAQTPSNQQVPPAPTSNFVRPVKKSSAIKITNDKGEAITFNKPSPSPSGSTQSQTPVIVSTPNAPTPPPRAPSSQRGESKTNTMTAEERKAAFQEQVKKSMEDKKRNQDEEEKAKKEAGDAAAKAQEEQKEAEVKKAAAEAEAAAAKAASDEKAEAEAKAAQAAAEKSAEEASKPTEEEEDEDARLEREIAEMEAREREEEELEKKYQEKRKKEREEAAGKEAERNAKRDEDLKRQEREAEEREAERERERSGGQKADPTTDEEAKKLFAALKPAQLGPGASESAASGTETPRSEDSNSMPPPSAAQTSARAAAPKPKPAHLKLETSKRVEPAEPTPGMQALKSARFLALKEEAQYPEGVQSPNPALNQATRKARAYDKDFLLQFQTVFKEKPSVDWDQRVKDTLGSDEPASARTGGGASRAASHKGGRTPQAGPSFGGPMGSFMGGQARTLPPGTTSADRFQMSNIGGRPGMAMPGQMGRAPSQLGMGAPGAGMSRTNSLQSMPHLGPGSPRQPSARGKGASKRDDRVKSRREDADAASKMPLTAGQEVKALEKSTSGWKPMSLSQTTAAAASQPDPSGNMPPDMVQRKVKAALNKMTPENFPKISQQILDIAGQSKNETDGRTLRQVIALTFEKACDEAHWAGMYARFCHTMLTTMSPDIRDETIKDKAGNPVVGGALFRKYLLNRCQEEFERGWQANLPEKPDGTTGEAVLLSDEYYKAAAAKRKGLGLIQFIGQLYKLGMLTLRIMHECVIRLLNFEGEPDEAAIENLTTLLRAVGATMDDTDQGKSMVAAYFSRIEEAFLKSDTLASRSRFMILDLIDLRKAGWKGKNTDKGPKTIEEVHKEAEAAAAKQAAEAAKTRGPGGRQMSGRGDHRNFSGGMAPPVDYSRTNVAMDDLRRLQQRNQSQRSGGGNLGPGGSLGPGSSLGAGRSGSRRGLGPGSNPSTRTSTPPVESKDKKEEPSSATNAFSALAGLDGSGEGQEDAGNSDATSPPHARHRSKSPLAEGGKEAS
ncbi:hypothetical protein K431DRAFT_145646 [Polychaeton citri CBS 116435]|uniref:MIF4G domain-containing protein n=1 Tax=Polychaeton citri CBS 116435 TaxID=1314669 RepID=A0A9P4QDP4_9PEZI|nr:hypothetical protein K431DRAFT_145646 [Polychaeton citri CBS 116435]